MRLSVSEAVTLAASCGVVVSRSWIERCCKSGVIQATALHKGQNGRVTAYEIEQEEFEKWLEKKGRKNGHAIQS